MNHDELREIHEIRQRNKHLKEINDKLLHKYVAEVTDSIWDNTLWPVPLCVIAFIALGIIANIKIGLGWSVIIAFCAYWICVGVYEIFITYPLNKSSIAITPANALRQTLLHYCWRDRVAIAISLPIFIGLVIWLAFELRHSLYHHFLGFEIKDKIGDFAFWFTLIVAVPIIGAMIFSTFYETPKEINRLVADIDELNCNNIKVVPDTEQGDNI